MRTEKKPYLTLENAKQLAKLCGLNVFKYDPYKDEGLNPDITFETPELEEKIKNYVEAKKELEELLELE